MSYLTIKYKRANYKLAGVSLPLPIHNFMVLYTLAKGTTKSKLLTRLIQEWLAQEKIKNSEERLIREIIKRTNDIRKHQKEPMSLAKYKDVIQGELIYKGLSIEQTDKILNGIKDK